MVKLMIGAGIDANAFRAGRGTGSKPRAVAPFVMTAPGLTGPGRIGTAVLADLGVWGGEPPPSLSVRWQRDGADIAGAGGASYTPGPADDLSALRCVVTAANSTGTLAVASAALTVTWEPPVAAGGLFDEVFDQNSGVQLVPAAGDFTGGNLSFSVTGAGAGIDPATGVVSLPTDTARSGESVTVTAMNSGGSAQSSFPVTVEAGDATAPTGPPAVVPQSLRSSRLAVTLAAAPDAGGAAITGYDLRHASSMTADLLADQSADEVSWQVLADVAPVSRVTGLAPDYFVHLQSRPVTDAGPGSWSEALTLKTPATDVMTFHDTFTTGADGAGAAGSGRLPDIGPAWEKWGGVGDLLLMQPAGTARQGGSAASLGSRGGRAMVFGGGFWAGKYGTLEVEGRFGTITGERLYILFGATDATSFGSFRVRNHSNSGSRTSLWIKDGAFDEARPSASPILPQVTPDAVSTLRLVRDGNVMSVYQNNAYRMDYDVSDFPTGARWGIGVESLAYIDNVKFWDVPLHVDLGGDAQPLGAFILDLPAPGVTIV